MHKHHEHGFSILEGLIILLALLVVVFGVLYTHRQIEQKAASKAKAAAEAYNVFSGGKSHTLSNEKAIVDYPANWQFRDDTQTDNYLSAGASDQVELRAPDGFIVIISVASAQGQDSGGLAAVSATPITFFGQSDYLLFSSEMDKTGKPVGNISFIGLSTSKTDLTKYPIAKNNVSGSSSTKSYFHILMEVPNRNGLDPQTAASNSDVLTAQKIVQSMKY